jgi:DNA polymerase-3 subunit epsilon
MYAVLDIETTGGKFNEEGITEIAIHKFDGHQVVDTFISLVNPEKEIQPFVIKLTGINNKMLKTAPKFHEVAKRVVEITQDTVLIAHNAQFDYRILRTEFRRLGFNFERKTLCTVELSEKLLPEAESYSLGKLVRSLGIAVSDRHRANGDALATLKLFKLLLAKDSDKSILKEVVRAETLGELSSRQLAIVESLPTETGVYYLHNKDGDIIYIGKSKNIKKRVNQHFTSGGDKARKLQKGIKKVSFEKTGSELVAILKEYEELKRNKPRFNQRQKKRLFTHCIHQKLNEKGVKVLEISPVNDVNEAVLTTFSNREGAKSFLSKINSHFQLTATRIENNNLHNEKIAQIFEKYSITGKNMLLVEKGREVGEYTAILLKNGEFKGLGFYDLNHQINNIHILESIITPMKGDANTKHLIETYLRKNRVHKIISLEPGTD